MHTQLSNESRALKLQQLLRALGGERMHDDNDVIMDRLLGSLLTLGGSWDPKTREAFPSKPVLDTHAHGKTIDGDREVLDVGKITPGVIIKFPDIHRAMRLCALVKKTIGFVGDAESTPDVKFLPREEPSGGNWQEVPRTYPVYISDTALNLITTPEGIDKITKARIGKVGVTDRMP